MPVTTTGMETATIGITLAALWAIYAGAARNGRVACPITVRGRGEATHIYQGFGTIRLERITGNPASGKGFQGEEIAAAPITRAGSLRLRIED